MATTTSTNPTDEEVQAAFDTLARRAAAISPTNSESVAKILANLEEVLLPGAAVAMFADSTGRGAAPGTPLYYCELRARAVAEYARQHAAVSPTVRQRLGMREPGQ